MWEICELRWCFMWFYLFGQTTYIPLLKQTKENLLIIASIIPKIISIIILFGSPYILCVFRLGNTFDFSVGIVLFYSNCNIFAIFIAVYQNIFKPFLSRRICGMYLDVIRSMDKKLNVQIKLEEFAKKFHWKIIKLFVFQSTISIIRVNSFTTFYTTISTIFYSITFIYNDFIILHIILFIELLHYILFTLNKKINQIIQKPDDQLTLIEIVHSLKRIHLSLWKISNVLNSNFSLVLLLYLLQSFSTSIFAVYWIFLFTDSIEQIRALYCIRKYFIIH